MKKIKKFYGLPIVGLFVLIGLTLIFLNPEVNTGGGLDLPAWAFAVTSWAGWICLLLAIVFLINTFRKENI